jgi:type 1 glutamine amidotransferase
MKTGDAMIYSIEIRTIELKATWTKVSGANQIFFSSLGNKAPFWQL